MAPPSVEPSPEPSDEPTATEVVPLTAPEPVKGISLVDVVSKVIAPKADPAIGATGDDSAAPVAFSPLATLDGAKRMLSLTAWFVVLMVSSIIGNFGRERRSLRLGALAEVDASIEYQKQQRKSWGDRLWIFRFKFVTWLDRFSADAIRVTYPKSQVLAKIFNEGAYLRAFFGSFTVLGAVAAGLLGAYAALTRDTQTVVPATWLLLAIVVIGVFDAFSGLIATFVMVVATLFTMSGGTVQDYRTLFGLFILGFAPALSAEAFRSIRRRAERNGKYRWERFSDFAIAPFIGGISTSAMISVLPALANLTLPVANHVLEFGLAVAFSMIVRVALEEVSARVYPARSDVLNPADLTQPTRLRKFISILFKAAIYIFVSTAIFGLSWQVYVACLLFVIPALIHLFEDRLPNSRFMWRLMPKGIPGMALSLATALVSVSAITYAVSNPQIMARYGFMLLAIPALVLTVLHAIGRHGKDGELKPILHPDRKWLYRLGGVAMYLLTLSLVSMA